MPCPKYHLKLTKTYELAKVDGDPATDADAKAYHLVLSLQVTNNDTKKHDVAYRLDGPNGLPVEGAWYATKVAEDGHGPSRRRLPIEPTAISRWWPVRNSRRKDEKFRKEIGREHAV